MNDRGFEVDIFRFEDAEGVVKLFSTIYGSDYPIKMIYNPEQLIDAFNKMDNIPVVTRTKAGSIIGYVAMFRSAPHKRLYEAGQGLVLPEFRNMGIAASMNQYICDNLAKKINIDAIFGEAVCNHTNMQRAWAGLGPVETAIEVDLMPASAYVKEKSASGRVSTLDMFRTYIPKQHKIYIPSVYEDAMAFIYSAYDDMRMTVASTERCPTYLNTLINTVIYDFAGVARISVNNAGVDFDKVFSAEKHKLIKSGINIIQVWLKLSCPWIKMVVQILRDEGFFFGGVLPRWFDDDGLLMQLVIGMPNWEGIRLYSERAEKILDFVKSDWEKTHKSIA